MNADFEEAINLIVEEVATLKVIGDHSRPWISKEISVEFEKLRSLRTKLRKRHSPNNHQAYQEQLEKTIGMLKDAEDQWIIRQCEQLDNLNEKEKWNKIDRMTNQKKNKEIQPIRFTTETNHTKYAFDDKEILELMEKHHTPRAGNKKNQEDHKFSAAVERTCMKATEGTGNKHFSPLMNNTITMEEVKDTFYRNKGPPGTDRVTASLLDKADRETTKKVHHRIWNLA